MAEPALTLKIFFPCIYWGCLFVSISTGGLGFAAGPGAGAGVVTVKVPPSAPFDFLASDCRIQALLNELDDTRSAALLPPSTRKTKEFDLEHPGTQLIDALKVLDDLDFWRPFTSPRVSADHQEGWKFYLESAGVSVESGNAFAKFARERNLSIYVRFRNPIALQFEGRAEYYPKDSDIPFKSGPDGLVRAISKEEFFKNHKDPMRDSPYMANSRAHWKQLLAKTDLELLGYWWGKWESALASGKYFVDREGYVRVGSAAGPKVYADIDLMAFIDLDKDRTPHLVSLGTRPFPHGAEKPEALAQLNQAVSLGLPHMQIRHGPQLEFGLRTLLPQKGPWLIFAPDGTVRYTTDGNITPPTLSPYPHDDWMYFPTYPGP